MAIQRAERARVQKRRRQIFSAIGVILLVVVVAVGLAVGGNSGNDKVAVAPTTVPPATVATTPTTIPAQPAEKPCVGLKDPLPKGSPAMFIAPGPAPTKLQSQDIKVGTGAVVKPNSKVTMNYVGVSCSTGKIFDSSYSRNEPFPADLSPAGSLIKGWQQGIPGMKVGGIRMLSIPSSLGYQAAGSPPKIAGNEALFFLVEAVKIP